MCSPEEIIREKLCHYLEFTQKRVAEILTENDRGVWSLLYEILYAWWHGKVKEYEIRFFLEEILNKR